MIRDNEGGLSGHHAESAWRYAARAPNGERGLWGGSRGGRGWAGSCVEQEPVRGVPVGEKIPRCVWGRGVPDVTDEE
jgi:hypothetical protein